MKMIFLFLVAISALILWGVAVGKLAKAIAKKKAFEKHYSGWDILSYVLDVILICVCLMGNLIFLNFGMMGTVEKWQILLNITDVIAILVVPISLWSIALSISLRKDGRSRDSFLVQFSCLPVYAFCLIVYYLILI